MSICSVNVGLLGSTSSACNDAASYGVTAQKGVVDAVVPVTVCDVIVEIVGNSTAGCPTHPNTVAQAGSLADLYVPAGICGVLVELDGKAAGSCMPSSDTPLVKGLPTNTLTQSAPIDGVVPVNVCSIVAAIAGSATNTCEPSHIAATQTGALPVSAPATVCSVTAALEGTATATCVGAGNTGVPIGIGKPGSGVSLPITLCGIQAALGGSASASCPQPVATLASVTPPTTIPVTLPATTPAPKPAGALAFTGAPLVLELLIGLMALIAGVAINLLARRQRGASGKAHYALTSRGLGPTPVDGSDGGKEGSNVRPNGTRDRAESGRSLPVSRVRSDEAGNGRCCTHTFWERAPLRGPLVPSVAASGSGAVGHDTTSHLRRNRTIFAAVSGAAAVLLIAVGVAAQPGSTPKSSGTSGTSSEAIGVVGATVGSARGTQPPPQPQVTDHNPGTTTGGTTGGGVVIGLASFTPTTGASKGNKPTTTGGQSGTQSTTPHTGGTGGGTSPGTGTGTGSGGLLTPVTQLLGHVVTTVGTTASTAAVGLTVTLPGLAPVTGAVSSVGGLLSQLGDSVTGLTV